MISLQRAKFLLIELTALDGDTIGGGGAEARNLIGVLGGEVAVVGLSRDASRVGRWTYLNIRGIDVQYFSVGLYVPYSRKTFVPGRARTYCQLRRYRNAILSIGVERAFCAAPESMLAISGWGFKMVTYRFAGTSNPLAISRYALGRLLASAFDYVFFREVVKCHYLIAAADAEAIASMVSRSRGRLAPSRVVSFPTRVDLAFFRPELKSEARKKLDCAHDLPIFMCCARLHRLKGWELALEAFRLWCIEFGPGYLWWIGDGEDRVPFMDRVAQHGLIGKALLLGSCPPAEVVTRLSAADVFVVASEVEGWSLAMLEALACGKVIVSTNVSGASVMVSEGVNGYILTERDPLAFCRAMNAALSLPDAAAVSMAIASSFDSSTLRSKLVQVCPEMFR